MIRCLLAWLAEWLTGLGLTLLAAYVFNADHGGLT